MAKEYKISTILDIFEKIPTNKISLCLAELGEAMIHLKTVNEVQVKVGHSPIQIETPMVWVDDDEGKLHANVTVRDSEDKVDLLNFSYTEDISGDQNG